MKHAIQLPLTLLALVCVIHETRGQSSASPAWKNYPVGEIEFINASPDTRGARIYSAIIPEPVDYITRCAREVLETLYYSPDDSLPDIRKITYVLKEYDGISAKSGRPPRVRIEYSTRWVERSFGESDTAKLEHETRGVLYHELTHAFQLEPQGIGSYGTNKVFWAFIEGMADAVRYVNGCFTEKDCPDGGSYMDGYRTTGFFLGWIAKTKKPDFLRAFNRSTLEVIPWSFDGAIKHVLGKDQDIDTLWAEYQQARSRQE
ncbi:MAG: basic secretory family protein [Odoribacteraceae bacterium]|jgi:hypothetical protein|nr:basic secretory family protein [Odoribacteraceae bacterium]